MLFAAGSSQLLHISEIIFMLRYYFVRSTANLLSVVFQKVNDMF